MSEGFVVTVVVIMQMSMTSHCRTVSMPSYHSFVGPSNSVEKCRSEAVI